MIRVVVTVGLLGACASSVSTAPSHMTTPASSAALTALIRAVPSYQSPGDPLALIRAVNSLQRLGRDAAIAALTDYLHTTPPGDDHREGTIAIMRVLFDPANPPGYLPVLHAGAPDPAPPDDPLVLPRFPIAIIDDIPLVVVNGYTLGGKAETPEMHLATVARTATFRTLPLKPPDDPLAAIDRIAGHAGTTFLRDAHLDDDAGRARLLDQALRLIDPQTHLAAGPDLDRRWKAARTAAHAQRWDGDAYRPR